MKKGSAVAVSEGVLKSMVKIPEEYQKKLILLSFWNFNNNFKTLPVYYKRCLRLSQLYMTLLPYF